MEVRDVLTGRTFPIAARATINAAGARVAAVMSMFGDARDVPMVKAMNLVTTVPASDIALAAPSSSGRMLTLVPWRGRALIGTSQSELVAPGTLPVVTRGEVDAFIAAANTAFPALHLDPAQVALVHRGIVPAVVDRQGRADLRAEAEIIEHPAAGAFSVIGPKYTTVRSVAERTVDTAARRLGARISPSRTAFRTLPGAGIADHEALAIETTRALHVDVPLTTLKHLVARYAEQAADILRLVKERPGWLAPLAPDAPTVGAEVIHAIRHEMAMRLSDIVIRRTGAGAAGRPSAALVSSAAAIAATEMEWDQRRVEEETDAVDRFYVVE
jgi:glycerol-3-phosphate dehydrogenase